MFLQIIFTGMPFLAAARCRCWPAYLPSPFEGLSTRQQSPWPGGKLTQTWPFLHPLPVVLAFAEQERLGEAHKAASAMLLGLETLSGLRQTTAGWMTISLGLATWACLGVKGEGDDHFQRKAISP